jgi:DinB family protein
MTNEARLQQTLDRIQKDRSELLSQLEGLSQTQMDFKPAARWWSLGEVAHHLCLAEKMVQNNLKELLREGKDRQSVNKRIGFQDLPLAPRIIPAPLLQSDAFQIPLSIMTSFAPRALQSFLLANPIFKARAAPILQPQAGIPQTELLGLLHEARDTTLKQLESVKSWDLTRLRWNHPLLGQHDAYGMLELLADHDRRHLRQVEGIKRDRKFPGSS